MVYIVEPFLDDGIIRKMTNLTIIFNNPTEGDNVLEINKPYEGRFTDYYSVIQPKRDKYMLYYRAVPDERDHTNLSFNAYKNDYQYTCVGFSKNGKHFTKPKFNFVEKYNKSNIIINDHISHNFHPIVYGKKFLGIGGSDCTLTDGIHLLKSNDGIHWKDEKILFTRKNVLKQNKIRFYFDSLNQIIYDGWRDRFLFYLRHNVQPGVRGVQISSSKDLKKVSKPKQINIVGHKFSKNFSIYAPTVSPYPESPYFIAFSTMIYGNDKKSKHINVYFSRDGYRWSLIKERFVAEYYKPPYSAAVGLLMTPRKESFLTYVQNMKTSVVKLFSFRRHRIGGLQSNGPDTSKGLVETVPLFLNSFTIYLNFAAKKDGFIRVILIDLNGATIFKSALFRSSKTNKKLNMDREQKLEPGKYIFKIVIKNATLHSLKYDTNF